MDPWSAPPIDILPVEEEKSPYAELVDPRLPQPPFRWGVVGASGSGKSVLVSNLLSQQDLYRGVFDRIYVFSPTAQSDPAWTILGLNEERIYPSYSDETFQEVLREVRGNRDKGWLSLIVFDDHAGNNEIYSQAMTTPPMKYSMRARHDLCSLIFISQDLKLLPKKLRGQLTALSLFHPPNKLETAEFAKNMGGGVDEKKMVQMINAATAKRFGFFQATQVKGQWVFSIGFQSKLDPADF
jgi:predicted YcjX-like family ATPase